MFPERITPAVKVLLSLFILQAHLHQAFPNKILFCSNEQEESVIAIDGQTIHVNFTVHKLQSDQYLVWNTPDSKFQLPFHMYIGNKTSLQSGRYSLTYYQQGGNIIYEMSIMLTDENDTGMHTVSLDERGRQLCFIFQLNLKVEMTKPICETLFDKKRGKLQMSCQWLQVNDGDRARLVAEDQVLYEHETSEMNLDGQYKITNKYSIFVRPEKLNDASTVPTMCEVFYSKTNKSSACLFRTAPGDLVQSNLTKSENATFKCCNISWFIVDGSSLKNFDSAEINPASFPIFLCGKEGDDSNMLVIESIGYLNVDIQKDLNIISILTNASGDPNASKYSSDGSHCQILTVYMDNISKGRSLSDTVTPATSRTASQDKPCNISNNSTVDETKRKRKELIVLSTIIVITGFALTLSIGVQLGNYMCKTRRRERCGRKSERNISSRMNSAANFGNTVTESVEMTASSEISRPSRDVSCPQTSDRDEPGLNRAIMPSCSGSQTSVPILPARQDLMCRPFVHTKHKAKEQSLTAGECPPTTDYPAPGDRHSDHHYEHTESVVVPSAPSLDNTYCSLDDVEGGTANTKATDPHVSYPLHYHQEGLLDPYSISKACSSSAGTLNTSPDIPLTDIRPNQRAEMEDIYAKPDMSRKTKKTTPSESAYDDPRQPGEDFWQRVQTQNDDL